MTEGHVAPFTRAPDEGLTVDNPLGGTLTFKAMSGDTDGALTALETIVPPGAGPPLHIHREVDETIYALEGQFQVKLGDRVVDAAAGSFVFIPRGTPHTWRNAGDCTARMLATTQPADHKFEQFFVRYAQLPPDERGPDAFARIAAETEALEVVGPPMN